MRVLVVEDESALSRQLAAALGAAGYAVDCATDGMRAEFLGATEQYDAVVLDLGLPAMDGLTLLRRWRAAGVSSPVLILTARGSWHEKVVGIDSGADDYVTTPFQIEEVLARLRGLIRRASGQLTAALQCGSIALDARAARVTANGLPVRLTSHKFRVLSYLMHHRGRVVPQAGDLAHGLKTPLAILAQDIERAATAGQHDLAASIRRQVERMRRQIDSHLAQARATASGAAPGVGANVADSARGLVRTMERLYADRALAIVVDAPADVVARVPVEDLEEMLGNLLDNACKWARSRVTVTAVPDGARIVTDDGVGLEPSMRDQVLQRGVRADETAPGSGLGLAIVRDLTEAYGGSVALGRSPQGGVRARLILPCAIAGAVVTTLGGRVPAGPPHG